MVQCDTASVPLSSKSVMQNKLEGPAWLSGKVFDSKSRGSGFEPHKILWVFSWECPWARHFRALA